MHEVNDFVEPGSLLIFAVGGQVGKARYLQILYTGVFPRW